MGRWGCRLGDARRDAPLRFARALRARFSTFKLGLRPSQGSRCRPARGTRTQGPGKARSSRPPTWRGERFARWHAPRPCGSIPTAPVLLDMHPCPGTRSSHAPRISKKTSLTWMDQPRDLAPHNVHVIVVHIADCNIATEIRAERCSGRALDAALAPRREVGRCLQRVPQRAD